MDHPARRSHAARWIRGQRNCIIAAAAAALVLLMVRPVHMRDAGLPLVRILNRLLLAARAATSEATATISVALATAAHLLRSSRGVLPVAAVLQDRGVGLLPTQRSPIRAVSRAATRRVRE